MIWPMIKRFKDAWLVLRGRAVAVRRHPRNPKTFYSSTHNQTLEPYPPGL